MTQLALHLFGAITAVPPLHLPTDKTRALLATLACQPNTPLRREALAGLLWPDQPEELARQNLRKTIGRLKQALNEAEPDLADGVLTITRQTIELHGSHTTADVLTFRTHLEAVRSHHHPALAHCPACHMRLQAAVALSQQGEFLAGLTLPDAAPFDEWLLIQRENLHQQQLAALHQLAQTYEAQGAWEPALQCARTQIALEPWREEAHRQAMRLLASHGRRAEAIAQYQTCRQILQDELGVEPTAETETLLAQIRAAEIGQATPATTERLHHFPTLFEPLIGREAETAAIAAQLAEPTCRLLTITGQGGMGKTSLATAVGQALAAQPVFADGLYFISLEGVETAAQLVLAIGRGVELGFQNQQTSQKQLAAHFKEKNCLLVLDNFEQLVENAAVVSDLLAATAHLTLLVTSREPLSIRPEQRVVLEGLAVPPEGEPATTAYGAVRLFEQVGQQVQPRFAVAGGNEAAVAEICRRVEGLPLAIELAAHWLRLMSATQIGAEIGRNLDFLASSLRDVPERHRSMRVVFEQSWSQLTTAEQQLLARLSVFRGGFALADGLAITQAGAEELAVLLDKSLVHRTPHGRYTLHELIRQFAAEKLADAGHIQQKHSLHYLAQLRDCGPQFLGATPQQAQDAIHVELGNVLLAWQTAVGHHLWEPLGGAIEPLMAYYELMGSHAEVVPFLEQAIDQLQGDLAETNSAEWMMIRGYLQASYILCLFQAGSITEVIPLAEALLEMAAVHNQPRLQGMALNRLGLIYWRLGERQKAVDLLTEAYQLFEGIQDWAKLTQTAGVLSIWHRRLNQPVLALAYAQQAYDHARHTNFLYGLVNSLEILSYTYQYQGQFAQAVHYRQQMAQYFEQLNWPSGLIDYASRMGDLYVQLGEYDNAIQSYEKVLSLLSPTTNLWYVLNTQSEIAQVYGRQGRYDEALALHQKVLRECQKADHTWGMLITYIAIGEEWRRRGQALEADLMYQQAWQLAEGLQSLPKKALILSQQGVLAIDQQKWAEAGRLLAEALRIDTEIENKQGQALHQYHWGLLYLAQGRKEEAARPLAIAHNLYIELRDAYYLAKVAAVYSP